MVATGSTNVLSSSAASRSTGIGSPPRAAWMIDRRAGSNAGSWTTAAICFQARTRYGGQTASDFRTLGMNGKCWAAAAYTAATRPVASGS